ncbi:helix-turn-helix domain-containing protein [Cohnella faecalis]|uniref:helix-turn-helix domain-containing protein n=1 Tax=Cohnella faecalis TaxID=2315694 RepID=UPI00131425A9|nr:helix-turn-helix domain-containing protein [Cohnella faecalis]
MNTTFRTFHRVPISLKSHRYSPGSRLKPAMLRSASLLYVTGGRGRLLVDGNAHSLRPDLCVKLGAPATIELEADDKSELCIDFVQYRTMSIQCDGERLQAAWLEREADGFAAPLRSPSHMTALLSKLRTAMKDRSQEPSDRKQAVLCEMLDWVNEHEESRDAVSESLQRTIDYMNDHFAESIPLAALAGMAGLTPSSYCRAFKQAMGMTPGTYLTQIRLDLAKTMLAEPRSKLKEVAEWIGFQDELYFSRLFKKWEGIPPTVYMKKYEKKIAVVSGHLLQDHLLSLGVKPSAASGFPTFYRNASGFPSYLQDRLAATMPINSEKTVSSRDILRLSPDLILKTEFPDNPNDVEWLGANNTVIIDAHNSWDRYLMDVAVSIGKEPEAEKVVRDVKKTEKWGRKRLESIAKDGKWTIVRLLAGDCRMYGRSGHALSDLFYRDLGFRPDDGLEFVSYAGNALERLAALDPSNLLLIWSEPADIASFSEQPLWQRLKAVREKKVFCPDSKQWDPWGPIGRQYMIREMTKYFRSIG